MFQRLHFQALAKRLDEPRSVIQILAGPRQVGKTTLVGQLLSASNTPSHIVSADGIANANAAWLGQQWETTRLKYRQSGASEYLLAVGAHLINHARQEGFRLFYWREGNDEIDFLMQYRGKTLAIEVKSGALRGATGMEVFRKKFNPDKMLLVGTGGLPWEEFLMINPTELF